MWNLINVSTVGQRRVSFCASVCILAPHPFCGSLALQPTPRFPKWFQVFRLSLLRSSACKTPMHCQAHWFDLSNNICLKVKNFWCPYKNILNIIFVKTVQRKMFVYNVETSTYTTGAILNISYYYYYYYYYYYLLKKQSALHAVKVRSRNRALSIKWTEKHSFTLTLHLTFSDS
jgi:hypothetical protein